MGPRPSGVAEVAVVGLLDIRWQLNVDPSESHWSVLVPGAWEGTGMDGPGSRWAGSDEWAGRGNGGAFGERGMLGGSSGAARTMMGCPGGQWAPPMLSRLRTPGVRRMVIRRRS